MLVKLLKLPLDLPEGSPAKLSEDDNLFTRLGDYVSRCMMSSLMNATDANFYRPVL
jgi:hypothetical protein